jgi:hypothetical protein
LSERELAMGIHPSSIRELTDSGELERVDALAEPINSRMVHLQSRAAMVTDGPCIERAVEIAAPIAEYDAFEVRPLMDLGAAET